MKRLWRRKTANKTGADNGKASGHQRSGTSSPLYSPSGLLRSWSNSSLKAEQPPEFHVNHVNEDHIQVFAKALASIDEQDELGNVEHIRSVSDFAPIRERTKRNRGKRKDVVREGWAYHISRYPLLASIFMAITLEFLTYIAVRQLVNVIEFFSGWRGRLGQLRLQLRRSRTFDEWKATALELDEFLGYSSWKKTASNAYYDAGLVRRVTENLIDMREKDDAEGVCAILEVCLRSNFAGIESSRLYSETHFGTKDRIKRYIEEVEHSLEYLRKTQQLSWEDKAKAFRYFTRNNGTTALCLSGGASFGYYHFGVVRALLDAHQLPKVITGTSAGALIAAFVCTHTDDELERLLTPALADMITACEEPFFVTLRRWWKTGARFDTVQWARKSSFFTYGSMTFKEAYERTGRILNVSVIPYDTHSPTKLLNVHTAPDCIIFTAIIASAAVPGILNPVVLMVKDRYGRASPWQFQGKHKDGSLRVDIPLQSLHLFFNVTYSIISQVNPHIHLFFFQPRGAPGKPVRHRKGKGWRGGFFLSAAEQFLKLDLTKNFRVIRDLELMPELGGQNWSGVFLQKFEGSVTIWPKSRFADWFRLLADPDRAELARMIRVGQSVTWPKLHMIDNRLRIERQIDAGRAECRARLSKQARDSISKHVSGATDSSAFEDSDEELDLGGPEGAAPLPDTDKPVVSEDEDDGDDDAAERHRRRAMRAVSVPAEALDPARRRRREILSNLGLTPGGSPMSTPSTEQPNFFARRTRDANGADEAIPMRAASERKLQRRLSTGQLLLRKRNKGRANTNMLGSGISDDDEMTDG